MDLDDLVGVRVLVFPFLIPVPPISPGPPLLLDVAATEQGCAHVITDGLVGEERKMMPLLGFLAKSRREAEFPTEVLLSPGWLEMLLMMIDGAGGVILLFSKKCCW